MIELIEQIRQNLREFAYPNEASISHGIVTPILQALGWNTASPAQLVPEYTVDRRRVDFALLGAGKKPTVFIEVKGQGLAAQGDRQLFEYAFHDGVPLCVLTDGAEWSVYLPSAQGSYDDRRVYRLQLDERSPHECQQVLTRYLQRERVCSGKAYEDAQRDYRAAASRREAVAALPQAWEALLQEPDATLLSLVSDKAESLSGFSPSDDDVLHFLEELGSSEIEVARLKPRVDASAAASASPEAVPTGAGSPRSQEIITATLFGATYDFETASAALVKLLSLITARDPARIPQLAAAVRGRKLSQIARSAQEIHPKRPDLAKAAEFSPGWFVLLTLSNWGKMRILKAACRVYELPDDALRMDLPNA